MTEGDHATYKKYQGQGTGHVNIPKSAANMLGWVPDDNLILTIEIIKGKQGIFIYNKDAEKRKESKERSSYKK